MAQELARLGFEMKLAQGMAGVVIGDTVREKCADVIDLGDFDEEFGKLEGAFGESGCLYAKWTRGQKLGIKHPDHCGAGAGRADDGLGVTKNANEALGDRTGLIPVPGIESRLAAAGLGFGEFEFVADASEDARHVEADLRGQLIDKAGNEESQFSHGLNRRIPPDVTVSRAVYRLMNVHGARVGERWVWHASKNSSAVGLADLTNRDAEQLFDLLPGLVRSSSKKSQSCDSLKILTADLSYRVAY